MIGAEARSFKPSDAPGEGDVFVLRVSCLRSTWTGGGPNPCEPLLEDPSSPCIQRLACGEVEVFPFCPPKAVVQRAGASYEPSLTDPCSPRAVDIFTARTRFLQALSVSSCKRSVSFCELQSALSVSLSISLSLYLSTSLSLYLSISLSLYLSISLSRSISLSISVPLSLSLEKGKGRSTPAPSRAGARLQFTACFVTGFAPPPPPQTSLPLSLSLSALL